MSNEKGLFTISEDENLTEEIISVGEEDNIVPLLTPQKTEEVEETDWRKTKHPKHFIIFLNQELGRIPRPAEARGNRSKLERLMGQLKTLDNNISRALHSDYDSEINVDKVDEVRRLVEQHKDEVQDALDGMDMMSKQKRQLRRKRAEEEEGEIVKEAGTPHFSGIQTQISAFERAIVGSLINGAVSGGKNIEEMYEEANKKYSFTPREELALFQILTDMGYVTFRDRLTFGDKDTDPTREDNKTEWPSQYYA